MRSRNPAVRFSAVAAAISVACAGCGGSTNQVAAVRAAVSRYAYALRANDFKVVCATLTPTTTRLLVQTANGTATHRYATCPDALAAIHKEVPTQAPVTLAMVKALVAAPIHIQGNTATVTDGGGKFTLVRIDGHWLGDATSPTG